MTRWWTPPKDADERHTVLDPEELYELEADLPDPAELGGPVLVQAMSGFVDAGSAARIARDHLLTIGEPRTLARFDTDQLHDYRARRPVMRFAGDHWASYPQPELALRLLHDATGTPYLLLDGPEPDVQWERFVAAVQSLARRFDVRLTIGLDAIPMAVPHTRPVGLTAHGTRPELVAGRESWVGDVQVPGTAGHLLEFRRGEAGEDAMGFAVHVPHYLLQIEYPAAAVSLLEAVADAAGLVLPAGELREAAERTRADVEEQVARSEDVASVVHGLEQQYDAYLGARGRSLLATEGSPLPSGDELGAELERFLAEQARRDEDGREG